MALQHIRSSTLDKRPQPASLSDGQLAINTNLNAPGVFFKDSNGALVKVGPTFVGTTAPNSTPGSGGATGNTLGEQWLDTSGGTYVLKIWDGTAWRSEAGEFVNVTGDTMTGALVMDNQQQVRFRETTANGTNYIALQAPASVASDKTITLPDVTGTVVTTGDTGSVTSTMILDGTILNADVNASAAIAGTKISPDFGSQNVTTTGTVTGASLNPTSSTVPTNGVYLPAANSVGISTGGTGRLFVNSSGLVGIGTSSPNDKLDISTGNIRLTDGYTLQWGGTSTFINGYNAGILQLCTGSTPRLYINSSGNVGIGTTAPSAPLHVKGGTPQLWLEDSAGGPGGKLRAIGSNNGALTFLRYLDNGTLAGEHGRFDADGRLLLGTSSPRVGVNLELEGTSAAGSSIALTRNSADGGDPGLNFTKTRSASNGGVTAVQNGDGLGSIVFRGADGAGLITAAQVSVAVDGTPGANDMPGRLVFSTTADGASSPTERMRITNEGWLRATTTGTYQTGFFHEFRNNQADRTVWFSNTNASPYGLYVKFQGYDPNGTSNEFLVCDGNGTIRASIRSNGGLANFSANNANLSDRNAKKDITPAAGTWDCIKEWEIVNYRYKDQPDDADLNLGVIAQQVAESCPEVITVFSEAKDAKPAVFDDDGNEVEPAQEAQPEKLGVKEQQMYWMAIKALQEAQVRIEALEAEVAALKAQ